MFYHKIYEYFNLFIFNGLNFFNIQMYKYFN